MTARYAAVMARRFAQVRTWAWGAGSWSERMTRKAIVEEV